MEQSCIADEKACKQIVKKRTMKICIDVEEKDQTKKKERQLIE